MKVITIQISVPEGVEVRVSNGGEQRAERPFVPLPDPPYPGGGCPYHGDWRMVKAGTSKKTGKQFNSFWACSDFDCNEKPGRPSVVEDLSDSADLF